MPTKREREYYAMGFEDGFKAGQRGQKAVQRMARSTMRDDYLGNYPDDPRFNPKRKRKLSAWQRYIKNKRNHITYRDGKLNLKAMGVQYSKKKRR